MKKSYFLPAFISVATLFTSCKIQEPISTNTPVNNNSYQVDFLFEYDGCKVYRFQDRGDYIYFTNCNNETTAFINDSTFIKTISVNSNNKTIK
jgi:hypothetical protein